MKYVKQNGIFKFLANPIQKPKINFCKQFCIVFSMLLFHSISFGQCPVVNTDLCDGIMIPGQPINTFDVDCDTDVFDVCSGGLYRINLPVSNSYLFSLVAVGSNATCVNPSQQSGDIKLYGDIGQTNLLGTSNGSMNSTLVPSEMNFANGPATTEYFLAVFNHAPNCAMDWSSYTLTVTCNTNPCEISSPTTHPISVNAGCLSVPSTFSVSDPDECANGPYSIVSDQGIGATVDINGLVTIPGGLSYGSYDVEIGVNDCGGNERTTVTKVVVSPVFGCQKKNVTLNNDCEIDISDIVLNGVCGTKDDFTIFLDNKETSIVTDAHIYTYEIFYTPDDNTSIPLCWNTINVEDKLGPSCDLADEDTEYNFVCGFDFTADGIIASPEFTDCSDDSAIVVNDFVETVFGVCGDIDGLTNGNNNLYDDFVNGVLSVDGIDIPIPTEASAFTGLNPFTLDRIIRRVHSASDGYGNLSSSCDQFIYIWRPRAILNPRDVVLECGMETDVETLAAMDPQYVPHFLNPNFDSPGESEMFRFDLEITFNPTRIDEDGDPEFIAVDHTTCGFISTPTDGEIYQECGNTVKFYREWRVVDCCTWNFILDGVRQSIKTEDNTAPEITNGPSGMDIGSIANPDEIFITKPDIDNPLTTDCKSQITIDRFMLDATDECSPQGITFSARYFELGSDNTGSGTLISTVGSEPFLPKGNYRVEVTATDDCMNDSEACNYYINIVDEVSPHINCKDVTVGLTNGSGKVCATNASAWKTCGSIVKLEVKIVGQPDDTFAECITLSCTDDPDGDLIVPLMYRAIDDCDNVSTVTCTATLQIDEQPSFDLSTCPQDETFVCITETESIMEPTIIGGVCDNIYTVDYEDESDLDNCGNGTIKRTYIVLLNGTPVSTANVCEHTITINDDVDPTFISDLPPSVSRSCSDDVLPEELNASDNCKDDFVVTPTTMISENCLSSYTRTNEWLATDDCGNTFKHTQIVSVSRGTDVTIEPFTDELSCDLFDSFVFTSAHEPTINNLCPNILGVEDPEVTFTLVAGSEDSNSIDPQTMTRTAVYRATDECGLDELFTTTITFVGCCTDLGTINILPLCISGESEGRIQLFLDANSPLDESELIFTATDRDDATQVFVSQPGNLFIDVNRPNPDETIVFVLTVEAIDQSINLCSNSVGEADCGARTNRISGQIFNEEFIPLEEAEVELKNTEIPMSMTNENGEYSFEELEDQSYTIAPHRNEDPLNGISTFDLVVIAQHVLGINPLSSPYKMIAADINMDESIDIFDMLELRQLILYSIEEFTVNSSWRFVNADYIFPDPTNPWLETIPEFHNIESLRTDQELDFIAVKIGDLDCSAETRSNATNVTAREQQTLVFETSDESVKADNTFDVVLRPSQDIALSAMQFTLDFDPNIATLVSIQSSALNLSEGATNHKFAAEGLIPFVWYAPIDVDFNADQNVTLTFKAKQDLEIADLMKINSTLTKAAAFNSAGIAYDLAIQVINEEAKVLSNNYTLYQNQPNPFQSETVIGFDIEQSEEVSITIFDLDGKLLYRAEFMAQAGYNAVVISKEELQKTGVLFYQLDAADYTTTKKMIILE